MYFFTSYLLFNVVMQKLLIRSVRKEVEEVRKFVKLCCYFGGILDPENDLHGLNHLCIITSNCKG